LTYDDRSLFLMFLRSIMPSRLTIEAWRMDISRVCDVLEET